MKKKWFKNKPFINAVAKTGRFKILMFLLVILGIFAAFNFNKYDRNLFSGIIFCHTQITFITLFHFLMLLATLNTCIVFYQYDNYLIRLENKKKVIKKLVILVLQINGCLLLLFFLVYLSIYNLVMLDCYNVKEVFDYGIKTDIYAIYTMFKFYMLETIFMIINTILFVILNEGKTAILNVAYILGFFLIIPKTTNQLPFLPWNYYYMLDYHSFLNEVMYFILLSFICIGIILLLVKLGTVQKRGHVHEN